MRLNGGIVIPPGWGFAPLKRLTRFGYGEAISADERDPMGTVKVYGSNGPFDQHSAANTFGPCIIVGRKGSYGKCQYSDEPVFAVDTTFVVDQRHTTANLRYLFHLLGILGLDELSDDTAVPGLSREKAYQSLSPLPPLETQTRIAAFLDEKTAQIDGLIARKQALLERLAEKRQAIITQAVTKGLNPAAPMKDSGIDWLGQIPAHWEVIKIKFATSHVVDCLHTTPTYDGDLLYPAIRTADVDRGVLLLDQARLVSQDVFNERVQRLIPIEGDILYSREGERFGMAALVPPNTPLCLGQRMMMFRVTSAFDPTYVMWTLNSDFIYQQVIVDAGGSTSPHVNIGDVINFPILNPPLQEQREIAEHVERERHTIQQMSEKVLASLVKLMEYRSSLITAAVTGQIEGLQ